MAISFFSPALSVPVTDGAAPLSAAVPAGSAAAEFVEGAGADVVPPPPHDAAETISAEISSDEITLFFIMILRSVCVLSVLFQLPIRFRRPRSVVYSCNHQGKRNICRL